MGKSYSYDISFKGTIYLLFRKKICPTCQGVLVKFKEKEYTGIERGSSNIPYTENYDVQIFYKCDSCNKSYPLEVLAGGTVRKSKRKKRSLEEIKKSDEKMIKEMEKSKKQAKYLLRLIYLAFFVAAFLAHILSGSIIPFLMAFPMAVILMIAFESSIKK